MNTTEKARTLVKERALSTLSKSEYPNGLDFEVVTVWGCYILGNEKFLFTTNIPDGRYYEVTYDKNREMMYVDEYLRVNHQEVPQ